MCGSPPSCSPSRLSRHSSIRASGRRFTFESRRARSSRHELTLERADFRGAVGLGSVFWLDARLPGSNLAGTRLDGLSFDGQLQGADLRNASFRHATMTRLQAQRVRASNADFDGAKLRGANFDGADLTNATFLGSDLLGATFVGATCTAVAWAPQNRYSTYFRSPC